MDSISHGSACAQGKALKQLIQEQIHALLHPNGGDTPSPPDAPQYHRLEWFQEINHSTHPIGRVKFDLVVGYNPHEKKRRRFSARVGYTIVDPAKISDAKGYHQVFRPIERGDRFTNSEVSGAMTKPIQIFQAASVPVEIIEQALVRTKALAMQPYEQAAYNPGYLEEMLYHLHEEASGLTVVSANFPNPLHPDLIYCFVGTGNHDKIDLHQVGFPKQGTPTDVRDIRTFRGCIGDITDAVHDSLAHSYICPTEFATACRSPRVESHLYFS